MFLKEWDNSLNDTEHFGKSTVSKAWCDIVDGDQRSKKESWTPQKIPKVYCFATGTQWRMGW